MGSGSLAAMAVFETSWRPNMSRDEAVGVVAAAIEAGIWNDLGSGSNVDVCVIEGEKSADGLKYTGKAKTDYLRNFRMPNEKVTKERNYKWRRCVLLPRSLLVVCARADPDRPCPQRRHGVDQGGCVASLSPLSLSLPRALEADAHARAQRSSALSSPRRWCLSRAGLRRARKGAAPVRARAWRWTREEGDAQRRAVLSVYRLAGFIERG